jgi:hypothetical protein
VAKRYPSFLIVLVAAGLIAPTAHGDTLEGYRKDVAPFLDQHCVTCHNGHSRKAGIAFDVEDPTKLVADQATWLRALKMLQAGMMPPKGRNRPTTDELAKIESWIKFEALGINPKDPDPGRVTLRRLNRTEYRNTIRDLMGVDYNATAEFPADDTGHGFDNLGDVLSVSPLLLEKYIAAAKTIVAQAVPMQPLVPAERRIAGGHFVGPNLRSIDGPRTLPYYKPAVVAYDLEIARSGQYQVVLELTANERYVDGQFDYNKCRASFKLGDKVLWSQELSRQGGKRFRLQYDQDWLKGKQRLTLEVEPLTPNERQVRSLNLRLESVTIRGPMAKEYWVPPANYARFFPQPPPSDAEGRREYMRRVLRKFATRAFRRPVDDTMIDRLLRLAEATWEKPGKTFESGVAQAMTVVLASPRFLFREELPVPGSTDRYPLLDEFSLASRLSYFLWSTMPDEELFQLAAENRLRRELPAQVRRMLADKRASEFVRNFTGQWLQARNVESAFVNAFAVLSKDEVADPATQKRRDRFRELRRKEPEKLTDADKKELATLRTEFFRGFRRFAQFELNGDVRRAMRQETEMAFAYIVHDDRSLLEMIDADYTFLNERLAKYYGIEGVIGDQMRKVGLPADGRRGGILTEGTFLVVTSNPDRTSPVKRGLYILDNLLGTPPPPPPPNIASLEQVAETIKGKSVTLKETLKVHRNATLCNSCHNRMDPLGLAFENYNALGRWRDKERNQPIEVSGELITGESFKSVSELKHILTTDRRQDYYRCLTEKMLIYALGRGLIPSDTVTVDGIVDRLDATKGKALILIRGIIDSPAFQRQGKIPASEVASR